MSDTESRLTRIATDVNNYFDNEMFDEFQIEVDWRECPEGEYSFDIMVGDEMILIEDVPLTLTDQEIKKLISDYIFTIIYDGTLLSETLKIAIRLKLLQHEILELLPTPVKWIVIFILVVHKWKQRR